MHGLSAVAALLVVLSQISVYSVHLHSRCDWLVYELRKHLLVVVQLVHMHFRLELHLNAVCLCVVFVFIERSSDGTHASRTCEYTCVHFTFLRWFLMLSLISYWSN